jgi:Na+-transporting NADH:ubiquinone oxidoreductase subunit NqrE
MTHTHRRASKRVERGGGWGVAAALITNVKIYINKYIYIYIYCIQGIKGFTRFTLQPKSATENG